jgi:anti-sigma factor RsiW
MMDAGVGQTVSGLPIDFGHSETQRLLPWYVNGQLAGAERERLQLHLSSCDACRSDLAAEQEFARAVAAPIAQAPSPEAGLARLHARIAAASAVKPAPKVHSWPGQIDRNELRWAAMAAGVLVLACTPLLLRDGYGPDPAIAGAEYRTLASSDDSGDARTPAAHAVRLVFSAGLAASTISDILTRHGGTVVEGPGAAGAYTVHFDGTPAEKPMSAVLAGLRSEPGVRLAEALQPEQKP